MVRLAIILLIPAIATISGCGCGAGEEQPPSAAAQNQALHVPTSAERQLADELFELINGAREDSGGAALVRDQGAEGLAATHAADMAKRMYIAHTTLEGLTVEHRLEAAGLSWTQYDQVIRFGPTTVSDAWNAWMAHEDARAILMADFTGAGIGVAEFSAGSYAWVVLLRTP